MVRDAGGVIHLQTAFARKPAKPSEPLGITADINAIELTEGALSFQDQGAATPLALDLHNIRVGVKNISMAAKSVIPFDAALLIKQGGTPAHRRRAADRAQRQDCHRQG